MKTKNITCRRCSECLQGVPAPHPIESNDTAAIKPCPFCGNAKVSLEWADELDDLYGTVPDDEPGRYQSQTKTNVTETFRNLTP